MPKQSRRQYIKAAGGVGVISGLAGCNGLTGNGNNNGEDGQGDDNTNEDMQDLPEMEITFAHPGAPDITTYLHRGAVSVKEYLERESDGNIQVNIAPGAELGGVQDTFEQALAGEIELAYSGTGYMPEFHPNINALGLPFAFRSVDHALYVLDNTEFGHRLWREIREDVGFRTLGVFDIGLRSFGMVDTEVRELADLEGSTIRVQPIEAHEEMIRQLGARPEVIDWGELYQALDQGVVDGQENPITAILLGDLQEVLDWIILDRHVFDAQFFGCSEEWFRDLHPTYQRMFIEAGIVGGRDARRVNRVQNRIGRSIIEEAGVTFYDPPVDVLNEFQERTQEPVGDYIRSELMDDPEMLDLLLDSIETASEELPSQ